MTSAFPVSVVDFDNFKLPQAEKRVNDQREETSVNSGS
jgi:hypothetical protein